jgi:predicted neuraminidase
MNLIALMLGLSASAAAASSGDTLCTALVSEEFIADSMPVPECHASSIVETDSGLLAAWFGGTHEGQPDVAVWLARRTVAGWTRPVIVADGRVDSERQYPCWNPVLHRSRTGAVMLFYKVGPNPREWWGMMKTTTNDGATWSPPMQLPPGVIGPVKNKACEFENGDILCPSSTEDGGWRVWFELTADGGMTWERIGPLNNPARIEAIQPALLCRPDGVLQAVGRTKQGRMFSMESRDRGRNWSAMELLDFWCANSGIDGVVLRDGRLLVVYNHGRNDSGSWVVGREMLNVALSTDGHEWNAACVLARAPGSEFSYPAVIQTRDGLVHITYTWKRLKIKHVVLDPSRLVGRAFRGMEWEEKDGR